MVYDIAIIGGGAAGLTAAIYAKTENPKLNIVILEALDRVGKKLITTGNGRCNITNKYADITRYHGSCKDFTKGIFADFSVQKVTDFFKGIGIDIVFEEDGRAYPRSYQASSVVDALRFAAEENGIEVITGCKITDIKKQDYFTLKHDGGVYSALTVICATGLLSGGKPVGSDGAFLEVLKAKGIRSQKLSPAIVQLKTDTALTRQLKGVKVDALVTLSNGKPMREEFGEVLFTDYGLSGPPILQVSRNAAEGTAIYLDFAHEYTFNEVVDILTERRENLKKRTNENFLTGFINKRVGQCIMKQCGLSLGDSVSKLTDKDIKNIAFSLKKTEFKVLGNTGFNNSQVTAGGILADEVGENLESKRMKGLFFAGEILDIDGDCGGFNLQWAFSSGMLTAGKAIECLRSK